MTKRPSSTRRRTLIVAGVALVAIAAMLVVIVGSHTRALPELYDLGPQVSDFKVDPKNPIRMISWPVTHVASIAVSGSTATRSIASARPATSHAPPRSTILVFPESQVARVRAAFDRRFNAPTSRSGFTALSFTIESSSTLVFGTSYFDGRMTACLMDGSLGDEFAKKTGLVQPKGGCTVTITEPVDWISEKLYEALHFLHLQ